MGFGDKKPVAQISLDRLAAVAGGGSVETAGPVERTAAPPPKPVTLEPDVSRIRKTNMIDETPEAHKRRLAAKTINFSTTFLIRIIIFAAVLYYAWSQHQLTGQIHRGLAIGLLVMAADFGRVSLKAMTPGSK
ncbi:hypothetical protein MNBD_ALPHA05-229 [hydrothermal vent metagenome]|uniref:Uncharacterized protein n=1 Tax=hydrothermal vent metagenome TaxID=652676 RepID=A0A3B0SL33_9ZZZZ